MCHQDDRRNALHFALFTIENKFKILKLNLQLAVGTGGGNRIILGKGGDKRPVLVSFSADVVRMVHSLATCFVFTMPGHLRRPERHRKEGQKMARATPHTQLSFGHGGKQAS